MTKKYRHWTKYTKSAMEYQASKQGWKPLEEKESWAVNIRVNVNRKSDIDNRIKSTLDALVKTGLVSDDRYCDSIHIERSDLCEKNKAIVEVSEI